MQYMQSVPISCYCPKHQVTTYVRNLHPRVLNSTQTNSSSLITELREQAHVAYPRDRNSHPLNHHSTWGSSVARKLTFRGPTTSHALSLIWLNQAAYFINSKNNVYKQFYRVRKKSLTTDLKSLPLTPFTTLSMIQ